MALMETEKHETDEGYKEPSAANSLLRDADMTTNDFDRETMAGKKEQFASSSEGNKMDFWTCTAYLYGSIIGSGIFITPAFIAKYTLSVGLSLSIWIVGAVITTILSIVYVELGTSVHEPGGHYAYAMYVGWEGIAFAFMLLGVVTHPAAVSVMTVTFGECIGIYSSRGMIRIPAQIVRNFVVFSDDPTTDAAYMQTAAQAIAVFMTVALTFLNFFSLQKIAGKYQIVSATFKVIVLGLIILTGFYFLIVKDWTSHFTAPFASSEWTPGSITMAVYLSLWCYSGGDTLNTAVNEVHDPKRTLPRAIILGTAVVCVTYLLINTAYFVVVTPAEMAVHTDSFLLVFTNRVYGEYAFIVPLLIALVLLGTINTVIFILSRMSHAAAREGQLLPLMSGIHVASGSPRPALVVQAILVIIYIYFPVDKLIGMLSAVSWTRKTITIASLLYIRHKKLPVAEGAVRVPISLTIIMLLICLCLLGFTVATQFLATLVGISMITTTSVIYLLFFKAESYIIKNDRIPICVKNFVRCTKRRVNALNEVLNKWSCKLFNVELNLRQKKNEKQDEQGEKESFVQFNSVQETAKPRIIDQL